jgi:hypothetical protein
MALRPLSLCTNGHPGESLTRLAVQAGNGEATQLRP